jgi:hypothetical protein
MKIKPQLYQTSVSNQIKKKVIIVTSEGTIQDIVKENLENVSIEVHDYSADETSFSSIKKDANGDKYQLITLD